MNNESFDPDLIEIGPGTVKGKPKALKKVAPWFVLGFFVILGVRSLFRSFENTHETDNAIRKGHEHSKDKINESHERANDKIKIGHEATEDAIEVVKAKGDVQIEVIKARGEMNVGTAKRIQQVKEHYRNKANAKRNKTFRKKLSNREWFAKFSEKFKMPDFSKIPIISMVVSLCPDGFEMTTIASMIVNFGALCFSRVRSFLNGSEHAPTIQHVVVGRRGSGKGYIYKLYKKLFARIIKEDDDKLNDLPNEKHIIQTAGLHTTHSQFFEILEANGGLHVVSNETEVADVAESFRNQNGLRKTHLRKGFSGEVIEQNNRLKNSAHGHFQLHLSYNFAGTPKSVERFFSPEEVEGGTASRVLFTVIPELEFTQYEAYPNNIELDNIQNQIAQWRELYCYRIDGNGEEVICPEKHIDLAFVETALNDWDIDQYLLAKKEGDVTRQDQRTRVKEISFRCAMVLYMMAGCPDESQTELRQSIIEIVLYIANYCMERYLYMFSDIENPKEQDGKKPQHLTQEQLEHWYPLHGTFDEQGNEISYRYIAEKCGIDDRQDVINDFKRYRSKLPGV